MLNTISLFAGAGGMDLGFVRAGFKVVWANDLFSDAVKTYRQNFGDHIVLDDIQNIASKDIPDCDVVIGGFPCQGFSVANIKRHIRDERNKLYLEFVRIVADKQPEFFVAENVKGLLSLAKGEIFKLIVQDFEKAGYAVHYAVLNAADYGAPQRRERVIILGVRTDSRYKLLNFPPKPTHAARDQAALLGLKPWVSVGEELAPIPEPGTPHNLEHHEPTQYKMRFNGYLGHRMVDPDLPYPTITARGDDRGGVVIGHHPNNQRRLTPREAALIQGFPLEFKFYGTKTSAYRQIANAVPSQLAEAVARCIMDAIKLVDQPTLRKAG